jgi:hypothetical protein
MKHTSKLGFIPLYAGHNSWENTRLIGCRCKCSNAFSRAVLMFVNLNLSIKKIIELNDFLFSFWRIFLAMIEVKRDLKKIENLL